MSKHNIQFQDEIRKFLEHFLKYLCPGTFRRISEGLKNKFELAMANETSVFELVRVDCA